MRSYRTARRVRPAPASGLGVRGLPGYSEWPGGWRLYNKVQKALFEEASRLTDRFPRTGSRFLESTVRPLTGSSQLLVLFARHNRRVMRGLKSCHSFLVVPDIHIGDAVMSQAALTALRDFFPDARVDYLVNRTAFPLIEGNPEASRVLPFFSNGSFPSAADLSALKSIIRDERYDLVINFCPYINDRDIGFPGTGLIDIMSHAPTIVRNEQRPSVINHFAFQTYGFTFALLSLVAAPRRPEAFPGLRLNVGDAAVEDARRFAAAAGLPAGIPVIMLNPDAASPFTRLPDDKLARLLAAIALLDAAILVGAGHTEAGIGERILATLPHSLRSKAILVPASLSLEAYTALIDLCDVFITGDTGPMHLAAARKCSQSGRHDFRNRTAVLSIFGATPARMSGHDSIQPGYLPANQEAPSWSYTAGSPCRNITCVNKFFKTCRDVHCFDDVDADALAGLIENYLKSLARR
ncbi:lipopolysaccharide heptosyltransferase family protein [bacterium]|nr:MAG: lipopolysaccharide heptosyltransferase family protein [bacterium]